MQEKSDSRTYDLFKLLILIVLGIILVLLWVALPDAPPETAQPEPVVTTAVPAPTEPPPSATPEPIAPPTAAPIPEPELPAFPPAGVELTYNPIENRLNTPAGTPVYQLDLAGTGWEPLVPADLAGGLPEDASLQADGDSWQLRSAAGDALYNWNTDTLTWEAVELPPAADGELPPFPEANVELTYQAEDDALLTPDGSEVYQLDPDLNAWVPVIPIEIGELLPPGTPPILTPTGTWTVQNAGEDILYTWDPATLTWLASEQPEFIPPDDASCPLAMPSQLAVGMQAQVVTWLNARSEPRIAENVLFIVLDATVVEIIGGPVCETYADGAHWWWEIRLPEGETGWSAEGAYTGDFYYLGPQP